MRKKIIIIGIVIAALLATLIPLGTLQAILSFSPDQIYNGSFDDDAVGATSFSGWEKFTNGTGAYAKIVLDGSNKVVELNSGSDGFNIYDYAYIWQYYIPITTLAQTFSFDVKPVEMGSGYAYVDYGVTFYDENYDEVAYLENYPMASDLNVGSWQTLSMNLNASPESVTDYDYEHYGTFAESMSHAVYAGPWVESDSYESYPTKIWVDNLRLYSAGGSSCPLTPYEWVLLDLNAQQLRDHYGPTAQGFMEMLYDNLFRRVYDVDGRNYWTGELINGAMSANQVAEQFIFNNEISSQVAAMNSDEFITFLYQALLARTPDAEGYAQWMSFMASGNSKIDTLMAFLNNPEWTSICAMYNVTP
jgi:hypothetical protein